MSSGQWEVVVRNKKDKANIKNQVKNGKNKNVPAPKVEDILPLSQVKSIYSNIEKSNKENKKPQEKENVTKKQPTKKPEKKSENQKPKPAKSIESALTMINIEDLKFSLETSKKRFPEAPLVWLKELSSYLNSKLNVELNDPIFTTKPDIYPYSMVPIGIKNTMERALNDAGKPSQVFFDFSLTAMANDMSKGLPAIGHKIWLQFLAQNNPQITVNHLEKHSSLRTSYQNRQLIGLSILWALGQGGVKDFQIGLKVFKDFMLPLLEMKNYSRFIIKYLSQLVTRFENSPISKENFMFLFDFVNTKRNLPNEDKQELVAINKKLKEILYKKNSDHFAALFEPLLSKLSVTQSAVFQKEVSDILFYFLKKDSTCYKTWKSLYSKQYQQSYILIKYISEHWRRFNSQLDKKLFKELLKTTLVTNAELQTKNKKDVALVETEKICKRLLEKMTVKKSFPWKSLAFVTFLSITTLLVYDVNKHGSWKKTQSVQTLKQIGVWEYGEKAWDSAHQGFNWTRQRIEEYAPGYIDATREALYEYVELARDMGKIAYNIIIELIKKHAPGLLEQLEKAWSLIVSTGTEYYQKSYEYLTTKVFAGQLSPENIQTVIISSFLSAQENIQKVIISSFHCVQEHALEFYNWAYEKVQSTVSGK